MISVHWDEIGKPSPLTNFEISFLIKLLREDYIATKINIESGLITNIDLENLKKDYIILKDRLLSMKTTEQEYTTEELKEKHFSIINRFKRQFEHLGGKINE